MSFDGRLVKGSHDGYTSAYARRFRPTLPM